MKNFTFYKRLLLILAFSLGIMQISFAQLAVGDIAFVQYNADGTDNFAFVTLVDIPGSEVVKFTDNEENNLGGGEGTITWTAPAGGVSCGTVITIAGTSVTPGGNGTATQVNSLNFAGSGDGIIAYQGTSGSPTFITALGNDGAVGGTYAGTKEGNLPAGLALGVNAQSINEIDNAKYNGALLSGTKTALLAAIYTVANWSGSNTMHQTFSGTFTVTTCGGANDTDSEVIAPGSQQAGANISSLVDTDPEAQDVFIFDIKDQASGDGFATKVTNIRIKPNGTNTADWTDHIQGIKLNAGGAITIGVPTITDTYIDIPIVSGNLDVADGATRSVTMSIYLNTSNIVDGAILSFMVDANPNGFTADASGSTFAGPFPGGDFNSNDFTVTVVATQLLYVQQPTNTVVNVAMSPDPTVKACDVNGNIDIDYNTAISVTSDGTLTGTPVSGTWSSGVATFASLVHTVIEAGRTLTAASGALANEASGLYDITAIPTNCASDLIISEYYEGAGNDKYIEIFNDTGAGINLSGYKISIATNGSATYGSNIVLGNVVLASGSTYIIAHSSANLTIKGNADQTSGSLGFNGDDAIALRTSANVVVDIVGQRGFDPGSQWGTGLASTKDNMLIRKSSVVAGDTNDGDVFVPATEWNGFANGDYTNMGSHTMTCACTEPTSDASTLVFSSIGTTSIDLAWTNGDGLKRIVIARKSVAVDFTPVDNTTYAANASFSSGTELGTGNYVVYNGNGNSFTVTNLAPGTEYFFKVYEYGCSAGSEDYYTAGTPLAGAETTLPENITNLTVTCVTATEASITWDLPAGEFDGILVTVRQHSTLVPSSPSCDGSTLNSPDANFSTALIYCGNATTSKYTYNASGTGMTITGLVANIDYKIKVFVYKGSNWSSGTLKSINASIDDVTGETANPANASAEIIWVNPTTCYNEILVVAIQAGTVTASPSGDGSAYTANSVFGSGTDIGTNEFAVYKGASTTFTTTGLTNGINYCFKIFVRKGTTWSTGVEVCTTPADVTYFNPGELVFVGFDSSTGGSSDDKIYLATLVPIKPGTKFKYVNSRYESGAAANQRTDRWYGGGSNINTNPGIMSITYNPAAPTSIPAGSVISFIAQGITLINFAVNRGTGLGSVAEPNLSAVNIGGQQANISSSKGDQMWVMQGDFTDHGGYDTFDGNVLGGMTSRQPWVGFGSAVPSGTAASDRRSRTHPDIECFNLDMGVAGIGYAYYRNGPTGSPGTPPHNATKRTILIGLLSNINWNSGGGTNTLNITEDFSNCGVSVTAAAVGRSFCITPGAIDGTWVGDVDDNWFKCGNWEGLTVPDRSTDVLIPDVHTIGNNPPDINCDPSNTDVAKYNYIAESANLTITDETLSMNGYANDTLKVAGDLAITGTAVLDFDDGNTAQLDGILELTGSWNNGATFDEGESSVYFLGGNAATMTSISGTENFHNLTLNNINLAGVKLMSNAVVENDLTQNNNIFDLNGSNLTVSGIYSASNSSFIGDASSDLSFIGAGTLSDLYFTTDLTLNNFTLNRAGENANLRTNLDVKSNMAITDGSVTMNATKDYYVRGTLTSSLASKLILKSDASGTASLINASSGVKATVERFLKGAEWHFVQARLNNADVSQ